MEALTKLERTVLGWFKEAPHLPESVRKWLGDNVWWLVAIATAATALYILWSIGSLFSNLSLLSSPFAAYYTSASIVAWAVVETSVSLVFGVLQLIILGSAITPLKAKQKKGWSLLFASLLVSGASVVMNAILTLSPFGFVTSLIFGAFWIAVAAYFIFEIHNQFEHKQHAKDTKAAK